MDMAPVYEIIGSSWPPLVAGVLVWPVVWLSRIGRADRAHAGVRRDRSEPYWVAPVLFAAAVIAMHAWRFGLRFTQLSAGDWRPHIAVLATVLALLSALGYARGAARWIVRFAALVAAGAVGSISRFQHLWKGEELRSDASWSLIGTVWWLGLFALVSCAAWWCIERQTDRTRGVSGPGVLCLWLFAAFQVISIGLSNLIGSLTCVVLLAALAPALAVALWRPRLTLAFGGATVPVLLTCAVVFQAIVLSSDVPAVQQASYPLLLLLAAALPLAADIGPLARLPDGRRTLAKLVLAGAGAMACAGVAAMLRPPPLE